MVGIVCYCVLTPSFLDKWLSQAGSTEPDIALGRRIADTLASVPSVDPALFDKMFNDSLQDLLMVRTEQWFYDHGMH